MLAAIAAAALFVSSAQAAPTAPLGHAGRWITDANGRVVILHGMNMVYKRPPYHPAAAGFGDDDAAFLQHNGFDAVRLGLIYKAVEPTPGGYDDAYLTQIAHTEADLARHGVFTQLDFHQDLYNERFGGEGWPDWAVQDDGLPAVPNVGFPGNYLAMPALNRAFDHFWANDPGPGGVGLQDRYASAWEHAAAYFASSKHTLGFDLMNEPWPGSVYATCTVPTGCPAFDQGTLAPFYRRVISRIRAVDHQKLLWYEPNVLFDFGADTNLPDLGDRSAGISFHVYCLAGLIAGTGGVACPTLTDRVFQNADAHARATGNPSILSEFGATDDLASIRSNVQQADQHMVSWEYWHYCECADPTTQGSGVQGVVIDPSQPPTGSNLKQAKLDVLSEPYPQVIAGTPSGYGFDPATSSFHLSYSTKGPGGTDFSRPVSGRKHRRHKAGAARKRHRRRPRGKSAETQIFVGGDNYPGGYSVSVTGGGIASQPGAPLLRILACPGRSAIDVTVQPASAGGTNKTSCRVTRKPKRRRRA